MRSITDKTTIAATIVACAAALAPPVARAADADLGDVRREIVKRIAGIPTVRSSWRSWRRMPASSRRR